MRGVRSRPSFSVGFVLLVVSLGWGLTAAAADHEEETLAGLPGVRVAIDEPDDGAGLTESALRKEVESRLAAAGIRVLSDREWQAAPGHPSLKLEVTLKREGKGSRLFLVELEVEQDVRLVRDPARNGPAATWAAASRFGATPASGVGGVLSAVREACDEFVATWRRANPGR